MDKYEISNEQNSMTMRTLRRVYDEGRAAYDDTIATVSRVIDVARSTLEFTVELLSDRIGPTGGLKPLYVARDVTHAGNPAKPVAYKIGLEVPDSLNELYTVFNKARKKKKNRDNPNPLPSSSKLKVSKKDKRQAQKRQAEERDSLKAKIRKEKHDKGSVSDELRRRAQSLGLGSYC